MSIVPLVAFLRLATLSALVGLTVVLGANQPVAAQSGTDVIRASRVLDGRGAVLEDRDIVVREGTIVAVVPAGEGRGDRVHDLTGLTVLPGLIDTHVHLGWHFGDDGRLARGTEMPDRVMHAAENAYRMLEAGFTTVQSLGGREDGPVRDAFEGGVLPGPRVLTSLGSISASGGDPAALRREVRDFAERGADAIKIFASESIRTGGAPTLSQEQLDAACGEAADLGLRTLVHAHGPESARRASLAGCTTIEHGALLDRATLELLAERGTFYDPNIHLIFQNYFDNEDRYVGIGSYTAEGFEQMRAAVPRALEAFRTALEVPGLRTVFGTDAVAGAHGRNADELVYRVQAGGQPAMDAIVSATSLAAESLGMGDRIGTVDAGFLADLVAVEGDPSQDIEAVGRVRWIMKEGRVVVYERGGRVTGSRPGRPLRREGAAAAAGGGPPERWMARGTVPDSVARAIDRIFADYDDTRSPGCAVGVVQGDRLTFARGYGMADLEHRVPLGPESVFRIGSVSKQFTAAAVVLLAVEGRLSLDDPVRRWVPELPDYGPDFTVRALLHHTSGVRDYLTLSRLMGYRDFDWYDDDDLLEMLSRQRETNFPPGSEYLYSNSGYWLLSEIVERVSGQTLARFADERFFDPLGMRDTHFHDDPTLVVPDRAVGYAPTEDGYRISTTTLPMIGDGGVFTSVEEMALWARNLADPQVGGDEWMEVLLTRGVLTSGDTLDYAMGLRHDVHRGLPTVGHGGSFVGYRAALTRFPRQDLTVTTLCNRSDADPSRRSLEVAEVFLESLMEPVAADARRGAGDETDDEPAPAELTDAELEAWTGSFHNDELDVTYRIRVEDGSLRVLVGSRVERRLTPVDEDVLRAGPIRLRAVQRQGGRVDAFIVEAGRVTNLQFDRVEGG